MNNNNHKNFKPRNKIGFGGEQSSGSNLHFDIQQIGTQVETPKYESQL